MMQVAAYGRLGQDVRSIETKNGKQMSFTSIAVELHDKDGEAHTQWLNVVTFGRVAEALARHNKGDLASISGRCQINRWTNGDGQEQVQLSVIADSIVSARTARPGGGKRKTSTPDNGAPFDDPLPAEEPF